MDPDLFNSLAGLNSLQPYNTSAIDSFSPGDLSLSSVDAGGSPAMPGFGSWLNFGADLFGAFGASETGRQQQSAYEYNADLALKQGKFQTDQLDRAETDTLSNQRAVYAKSGVTMSGSPLDVAAHTASGFEMDKSIANYNAQSKANMDKYEGEMARYKANQKAGMGILSAGADLAFMFL